MLSLIKKFAQWPWPFVRDTAKDGVVSNIWSQFRFENGEAINEVTEEIAVLYGATKVENVQLISNPPSPSNYMAANNITFGADEDFCISLNVNMPFSFARLFNTILGVHTQSGQPIAWSLGVNGDATAPARKLQFLFNAGANVSDTTKYERLYSTIDMIPNVDYHIEISRVSNILYMFINGQLEASRPLVGGNAKIAYPRLRTDVLHPEGQTSITTHVGGGRKWDIQIKKGEGGHTANFTPQKLSRYERAEYLETTARDIVLQLGFRRGSKVCENTGNVLTTYGTATVGQNARLTQTNVTSSYAQIPIPYFGAGDFTIEFMINTTNISQYGWGVGHYFAANSVSEDNRWAIYYNPNGSGLGVFFARSSAAGDEIKISSNTSGYVMGVDNHIVVQRRDGNVSIYVNGKKVAEGSYDAPLRGGPGFLRTQHFNGASSFAGSIWNIRIADRALYEDMQEPVFRLLTDSGELNPRLTKNGTVTVTEDGVLLDNSWLSMPHDPNLLMRMADFTFDIEFELHSIPFGNGGAASGKTIPIFSWSTWAHTNKPLNIDLSAQVDYNSLVFYAATSNISDITNPGRGVFSAVFTPGETYHLKLERKSKKLSLILNDTLVKTIDYPIDISEYTVSDIKIGRKLGGGTGNIYWNAHMTLKKFDISM